MEPKSLQQAILYFAKPENCREYLVARRGQDGCPRTPNITQKSAWFIDHRIRLALRNGTIYKMGGPGSEVEADETWIGGKAKNMHANRKAMFKAARESATMTGDANYINKTTVWGVLDRQQRQVRATVVKKVNREA